MDWLQAMILGDEARQRANAQDLAARQHSDELAYRRDALSQSQRQFEAEQARANEQFKFTQQQAQRAEDRDFTRLQSEGMVRPTAPIGMSVLPHTNAGDEVSDISGSTRTMNPVFFGAEQSAPGLPEGWTTTTPNERAEQTANTQLALQKRVRAARDVELDQQAARMRPGDQQFATLWKLVDGDWSKMTDDKAFASALAASGVPVVNWPALYFKLKETHSWNPMTMAATQLDINKAQAQTRARVAIGQIAAAMPKGLSPVQAQEYMRNNITMRMAGDPDALAFALPQVAGGGEPDEIKIFTNKIMRKVNEGYDKSMSANGAATSTQPVTSTPAQAPATGPVSAPAQTPPARGGTTSVNPARTSNTPVPHNTSFTQAATAPFEMAAQAGRGVMGWLSNAASAMLPHPTIDKGFMPTPASAQPRTLVNQMSPMNRVRGVWNDFRALSNAARAQSPSADYLEMLKEQSMRDAAYREEMLRRNHNASR